MQIKVAICDDSAADIEKLSAALYTYDPSFEIVTYTKGETLIDELPDASPAIDILFLDIYMPGIDGIKTAQKIRDYKKDLKIIFLSSSKEHYPQAYEVFAFNYIIKPFDRKRLYSVMDRAVAETGKERGWKVRVQYKSAVYSVDYRDIQYIESRNKLLLFHLTDGKALQCYGKLDEIIKELPEQFFIRCHQSFLINIRHVMEMGENYFRAGPVVIGISKKYLKTAKERYYAYLFSQMNGRPEE